MQFDNIIYSISTV